MVAVPVMMVPAAASYDSATWGMFMPEGGVWGQAWGEPVGWGQTAPTTEIALTELHGGSACGGCDGSACGASACSSSGFVGQPGNELAAELETADTEPSDCGADGVSLAPSQVAAQRPRRSRGRRSARHHPAEAKARRAAGRGVRTVPLHVPRAVSRERVRAPHDDGVRDGAAASAEHRAQASLQGQVRRLAFESLGSRVVQDALEQATDLADAQTLANELRGHVRTAIESPHANYVLQKVVEVLPPSSRTFIAEELLGTGVAVARHRYGCRILSRLLENSPPCCSQRDVVTQLFDEVVSEAAQLCRNQYARHVLNSMLEHGPVEQCRRVVTSLRETGLLRHATHRQASYVVEQALRQVHRFAGDPYEDEFDLAQLLVTPEALCTMAHNQGGCHVVRALLQPFSGCRPLVLEQLTALAPAICTSKHGTSLLKDLGLPSLVTQSPHVITGAGA